MIIHPGKGSLLPLILPIDDPYVREIPTEEFIDEVEAASEEQTLDEEE